MNKPNILVIDAETTGLVEPIGLVEASWAFVRYNEEYNEYTLDEESSHTFTTNPCRSINCAASAKHGIRDEDVTDDLPKIEDLPFPKEPCIFVAHNTPFDRPIFEPYLNVVDELCTLVLSRRLIHGPDNHQLATLACYCGLSRQISHRASGDVVHCAELLIWLLTKTGWTIDQMLAFYKQPWVCKFMPWGKHAGELMTDVPKSYLGWLSRQDLDRDMRTTVNYHLTGSI